LCLALAPIAGAATFTVTNLSDSGAGSLRQAILDANGATGADTITFASAVSGTITLASTLPTITDPAGLAIDGPGASVLTVSGDHAVQVFNVASGAALALGRLTVADGGDGINVTDGGGIYNAGTLTIRNATLSGNRGGYVFPLGPSGNGGAIFNSGTLTVSDSLVSANVAANGSGIYSNGTATVSDSTVSSNGGQSNFNTHEGGGIANTGTLRVTGSTLSENGAWLQGGGIVNRGTLTVSDSTLARNRTGQAGGGGIFNYGGGVLVVTDSTLSDNGGSFEGDGGGIFNDGTANVANSTLAGNSAGSSGGGMYNSGALTVTNSALSGNEADVAGGGICNAMSGTLTVSFSTLSGNSSVERDLGGGGIRTGCWFAQPSTGVTSISATILVNNLGGNCSADPGGHGLLDGGYNLSSDASCGFTSATSLTSTDALLGPLSDDGAATQTMALLAGSPAVNRIPAGADGCGSTITTDQRGGTRPVGTGCDVGAYEDASAAVQLAYLLTASTNIGPGRSLADKVKQIQGDVAANDTADACGGLNALISQVNAQIGKKIGTAQAASLITEARSIRSIVGC
jgi:hypothetical protein